jgi:hypothetical protein
MQPLIRRLPGRRTLLESTFPVRLGSFQIDVVHDDFNIGYVWRIYHQEMAPPGQCSADYPRYDYGCECEYCRGAEMTVPLLKGQGDTQSHARAVAEEHLDEARAIVRRLKLAGTAW